MSIPRVPDQSRFERTKELMGALWRGEMRGALGYTVPSPSEEVPPALGSESDHFPEQFLTASLNSLACRRWGRDYAVPVIQPISVKYGGGVMSTAYGSPFNESYNHTAPRIGSAREIDSLNLSPTLNDGLLPKVLETIRYIVDRTEGRIPVQMYNSGGPMDIASMVVTDTELLGDLYAYPEEVHCLLDSCTELYIEFYREQQRIVPEFVPTIVDEMYIPDGHGILCGEDWLSVMSPELALEFEVPYINRISDAFGGVAIHACGNLAPQFELLKKHVRNLRGLYFNAGECSFQAAVETFRGTDVVLMPRWALNHPYSYDSRLDFVKKIVSAKTDDVTVFLVASYSAYPDMTEEDPFAAAEEIVKYIEGYTKHTAIGVN